MKAIHIATQIEIPAVLDSLTKWLTITWVNCEQLELSVHNEGYSTSLGDNIL